MNSWRIMNELWLWSPKGMLTGSSRRAGSLQFNVGFERIDMKAPNDGLRACGGADGSGANCTGAYVYNLNIGTWYIVRPGLSVGMEYGRYSTNKIGRFASVIDGTTSGQSVDFDTFELGIRVEW